MRLTIVQTSLVWENPNLNRQMLTGKLAALRGLTDVIVLPEMFNTGFSMNAPALAEPMDGPSMQWLRSTASDLNAAITGSFICVEEGQYFNRLVWMFPDGRFEVYDKKHLFGFFGEDEHFSPGQKRLMIEWRGARICPLICYDLRFPVWSRNTPSDPFDLLIYVANWPLRRSHHWRALLLARAIENQAFVAGVNIVGKDGNGLEYSGDSAIVDFAGQTLCQISGQEGVFTAELSLPELQSYRQQLPFLKDADAFALR